jgi:glycine/D-amino acid oxidase-like deaminating enzyme/nitrite reductase/ring-hydroxylating ferredoxin subunit
MSIAYLLAREGKDVVVLEDGFVGSGETGRTTAHLTWALDDRFTWLAKLHGRRGARLAAQSHARAIEVAEEIVYTEKIQCDFSRVDGYLFLHSGDARKTLEDECDMLREIGFGEVRIVDSSPFQFDLGPSLLFPRQAQFHPMKFLRGLARGITRRGGRIYTRTHVASVGKEGVRTSDGHTVKAPHIVIATNTPINDIFSIHAKQAPYRSYVIGATVPKGAVPHALCWTTGLPYYYVRMQPYTSAQDLLIVGGLDQKTGQEQRVEWRYALLERWARSRFPMMRRVVYRWSGQVMEPADGLAFIGRNPGSENIYIHTGDSGNGITHGLIGGMLITDLVMGRTSPWESLYDPARKRLTKKMVLEGLNVAGQYADYVKSGEIASLDELGPGEGAIVREGVGKIAAYRDANGELHAFSAICPHMKCIVRWNGAEKSFDCPCHGSRFTRYGKVINGPANVDLARKKMVLTEHE